VPKNSGAVRPSGTSGQALRLAKYRPRRPRRSPELIEGQAHCSVVVSATVDIRPLCEYNSTGTLEVRLLRRTVLALIILLGVSSSAFSIDELPAPEDIVGASCGISYNALRPGMDFEFVIVGRVKEGWHINSNTPTDEMFVPTSVEFHLPEHFEVKKVTYPPGIFRKLSFSEKKLSVYEDEFIIRANASLDNSATPSEQDVEVVLTYQACNDQLCLEPVYRKLILPLSIVGPDVSIGESGFGVFEGEQENSSKTLGFGSKGLGLTFLFIFFGGLALNLTPCVYPMIPVTISYFGGQSHGSHRRLFMLAVAYLIGIAITYSILGLIAALTGSLIGAAMQNPIVLSFVALVLIALALSMFDVYTLKMPARMNSFAGSPKVGILGSLFMGLTLGIVIAPCVGPFVLGLLTYVGKQSNPLLGFWMFFTLAIGMGLPLVFLALVSGNIGKLPRSGEWMVWVKKVLGFMLFGMALYFLRTILPGSVYWTGMAVISLAAGVYLGWLDRIKGMGKPFSVFRKIFGVACVALFLWLVVAPGHTFVSIRPTARVEWLAYSDVVVKKAAHDGVPVIVDFTADWCIPCEELEEKTFSDPRVVGKMSRFLTVRVDLTKGSSDHAKELRGRYRVAGVPTVVFIGVEGKELPELRFVGFIRPDSLLGLMDKAIPK